VLLTNSTTKSVVRCMLLFYKGLLSRFSCTREANPVLVPLAQGALCNAIGCLLHEQLLATRAELSLYPPVKVATPTLDVKDPLQLGKGTEIG